MKLVRNARLALCLLVLLGLTSCSDEPVEPPICEIGPSPTPLDSPFQSSGLMKVGQQFTLLVRPLSSSVCGDAKPPTSVTAEIEGPGGEPVEGQIQLGEANGPATLQFTPVRAGPHHILIAFSQVGGLHQFDFHAVVDSSRTAPSYTLHRACTSLERTQQGSWVCDTAVLRGETPVANFPDARLAVAGDVIWVLSSTALQRYVDTGSELVMTGSRSHSQGKATFLLASADELAAVYDGALALYTFSGGTLASAGATSWSRLGFSEEPYGLLLREGSHFALVTRQATNGQSVVQACPYQLDAGLLQRTSGTCLQREGDVVGFEPRVLWTRTPPTLSGTRLEQGSIQRWEWSGGQLVEAGSVSLGAQARLVFPPMMNPTFVPTIYADQSGNFSGSLTAVAFWSAERRTILFEHLDSEVNQMYASPTFYWGNIASSASTQFTRIRLRPQASTPLKE
jgi:hypothetical protein